jgi:hypothetical protein
MSKVVIDCPLCGSKVKMQVEPPPEPARGRRWRKVFVWWWCQPVDIDGPERGRRLW